MLINQLKEVAPAIQNSIADLTEEVNNVSSSFPLMNKLSGQSNMPVQTQNSGKTMVNLFLLFLHLMSRKMEIPA